MGHKVFIVEDEPDLRDTLQYNLENEGFSVEAFSNGEDFLSTVDKNKPNLVYFFKMFREVKQFLNHKNLLVIRSSIYPGTCLKIQKYLEILVYKQFL